MNFVRLALVALALTATQTAHSDPWSVSVVDENDKPVAGAYVRATSFGRQEKNSLKTDDKGQAGGDLERGWANEIIGQVFVFSPGHAPAGGIIKSGENRVRLNAPHAVSGRITDDDGKPLPNVRVTLTNVMSDRLSNNKTPLLGSPDFYLIPSELDFFAARTDAEGRYKMDNLPARGTAIIAIGDVLWQTALVRLDLSEEQTVPDIKTRPAARLSGRVIGQDGKPLAFKGIRTRFKENYASAETDAEGRYVLGGLPSGEGKVQVELSTLKDEGSAQLVPVVAVAGTETAVPDIKLQPAASVDIRITPAVSGGYFDLRSSSTPNNEGGTALSAREGLIRAYVRPDTYELRISVAPKGYTAPTDWPEGKLTFEVAAGRTTAVGISLPAALKLEGVARDEAGKPVAGAKFTQQFDGTPIATDANGHFVLDGFKPGPVRLQAEAQWDIVSPQNITLPSNGPIDLTLRKVKLAPLSGRVVDERGNPIANASIRLQWYAMKNGRSDAYGSGNARTDADGEYEVADVREDAKIEITAVKPKHRFLRGGEPAIDGTILGVNGAMIPNPEAAFHTSDIVMQKLTREASGRVVDGQGQPVIGALVAALAGGQEEYNVRPRNLAYTGAEGRFKLSDLPDGEIVFVAGQGKGFVQLRSAAAELPDLVLQEKAKPTRDLPRAAAMIMALIEETRDNPNSYATALPDALSSYDFSSAYAAAKLAAKDGVIGAGGLRGLFSKFLKNSPEDARQRLLQPNPGEDDLFPLLERDPQEAQFSRFLASLTRLLPTPEKEVVPGESEQEAKLRSWVWRNYDVATKNVTAIDTKDASSYTTSLRLAWHAVLAAKMGDESAPAWAEKAVAFAAKHDASVPLQNDMGSNTASYTVAIVARGGLPLVERGLLQVPPDFRALALSQAIPVLADTDLAAARALLKTVPQQVKPKDNNFMGATPEYAFGLGAKAILAKMRPADAAEALKLARRATDKLSGPESLALAAVLQPKAEASALLEEAFAMASTGYDNPELRVVSLAFDKDEKLAEDLLKQSEDGLFGTRYYPEPPVGRFAFLRSKTQPGMARVWLEWQWARRLNKVPGVFGGPSGELNLIEAMSTLDYDRALEMAASSTGKRRDGEVDLLDRLSMKTQVVKAMSEPDDVRGDAWAGKGYWSLGEADW